MGRIKSLKDAVEQAIDSGARTVEDVYMKVSRLPFDQLERIAAIEGVVKQARGTHDRSIARLYATIRTINKRIGQLADQGLGRLGLEPAPRARPGRARPRKARRK